MKRTIIYYTTFRHKLDISRGENMGVNSLTGVEALKEMASVLKTFCHEARLQILIHLNEGDKTAKDLSELLDTSQTYIHRHIQIMADCGLIEKNGKNFALSTIGKVSVNLLGSLEVITKYNNYWENHSLSKISDNLMEDLAVLKTAKMISPAPRVIEKITETIKKANKEILAISDRSAVITYSNVVEKIGGGVEFHVLSGLALPNFKKKYSKISPSHSIEVRKMAIEDIYMGLLIADGEEAGVIFPDNSGSLDWNYAFTSKDPNFISWVEKNFWEMYNKAECFLRMCE